MKKAKEMELESANAPPSPVRVGSPAPMLIDSSLSIEVPEKSLTSSGDLNTANLPVTPTTSTFPILAHQPPASIESQRVPTEEEQLQRELEARYQLLAEDKKAGQEEERAKRVEEAKKRVLARKQKEQQEKDKMQQMLNNWDHDKTTGSDSQKSDDDLHAKEQQQRKLQEEEHQRALDEQRLAEERRLDEIRRDEEERLRKLELKAQAEEEERKKEEAAKAKQQAVRIVVYSADILF